MDAAPINHTYRSFGELLRAYRGMKDLTQEELAARSGLSVQAISMLERGVRSAPRSRTVEVLVRALALAPAERDLLLSAARRPGPTGPAPPAESRRRASGRRQQGAVSTLARRGPNVVPAPDPELEPLELAVLGLLNEQARHPQEMRRLIREHHHVSLWGRSSRLKDLIERLARDGSIDPVASVRSGRWRGHTVYQITATGIAAFERQLGELLARPAAEHRAFTATMGLMGYLPPSEVLRVLQKREAAVRGLVADLEEHAQAAREGFSPPRLLAAELELSLRCGELSWLAWLIRSIRSGDLSWETARRRRRSEPTR